jgi:hypothetical protein
VSKDDSDADHPLVAIRSIVVFGIISVGSGLSFIGLLMSLASAGAVCWIYRPYFVGI